MYLRHRWTIVGAALLFIAIVEALSDSVLDGVLPFPFDTIVVVTVVASILGTAAWVSFQLIDRLTSAIVERNATLEERNAALRDVYEVSLAVAGQADPRQTLHSIVEHARGLLRADAALLVVESEEGEPRLEAVTPPDAAETGETPLASEGRLDRFLRPEFAVRLSAIVRRGGDRVGSLGVATKAAVPGTPYGDRERETLAALATLAGIAIEAARIQEQLQLIAVQGERERIAREMHDGLAQVLGYVNTKSQAVEELLVSGRVEEARRQLEQLGEAARSVYVDVREAILSLSAPMSPDRGLALALEEYAAQYAESAKLAVRCDFEPEAVQAPVPGAAQAELFRIVREALTNVRKHAKASRVVIELRRDADELIVRVTDDGRGFDVDVVGVGPERWPHFGLAGMRERAALAGGVVTWRSHPGGGTQIEVRVPIRPSAPSGEAPPDEADAASATGVSQDDGNARKAARPRKFQRYGAH